MTLIERVPTVVVGGGIIGAAILYELARRGESAALFESQRYGRESTGKSAAIVRMHYSNAPVVRMALRSRDTFAAMPELLGCSPVYYPTGWLFLVDEANAEFARSNLAMQTAEGLDAQEVDPQALGEIAPGISTAGVAWALFEPDSGFADPVATTLAYIGAATNHHVHAYQGTRVERIEVEHDRVTGIVVDGRRISCERVILAAGAWSRKLAADIGLMLPLEITREQDVVYDVGDAPATPIAISSQVDRIYLRPLLEVSGTQIVVGRGYPKHYEHVDPDGYDASVDDAFETDVRERVTARFRPYGSATVVGGRVGLYTVTPDWHPILGPHGPDGLWIATGGSGHCFKLAPAIAELVVGAIVDEPATYADIDLFSPTRYDRGLSFTSTYGGNRG